MNNNNTHIVREKFGLSFSSHHSKGFKTIPVDKDLLITLVLNYRGVFNKDL